MSSSDRILVSGLQVARVLYETVERSILPDTGVSSADLWAALAQCVAELGPHNVALLKKRDELQAQIDAWHVAHPAVPVDVPAYTAHLRAIGYLADEPTPFAVTTANVDAEIATLCGPQLVVPIDNARYALNACNARWGSLFDALYGTNAIGDENGQAKGAAYNDVRGQAVFRRANALLDLAAPLTGGAKYDDVVQFALAADGSLQVALKSGAHATLADPSKLVGYAGDDKAAPTSVLFVNNGLHVEVVIDRSSAIGRTHAAGVTDVVLESALSTIQDCEDSVAAVDADDKAKVYANWAGLMRGLLACDFEKDGKTVTRKLRADRTFHRAGAAAPAGSTVTLPGRSLMLIRNVGIHMYTDAVLDARGAEIPEGLLDAFITVLGALHDLRKPADAAIKNSRTGSVYIVKPKQHGADEVAFTVRLFEAVERAFALPKNTIKIGIMDEERRTTVNLARCIYEARERVCFINTGFLDRTGDEIHTSMLAGPMVRKNDMRAQPWLDAYERWNVDVGLACGLKGRAQIGKGMWAKPDDMKGMLEQKVGHLKAGASCAWVPSPTAATLHALHYHEISVPAVQTALATRARAPLDAILTVPVTTKAACVADDAALQQEIENNAQGTLGYVARWIQFGVGCSKVPDINDVGLMEDRATLRISSQHMCNWLRHGVVDEPRLRKAFEKMAAVVDRQNAKDKAYKPMCADFAHNVPFDAAWRLVTTGLAECNGYTENVLHRARRHYKAHIAQIEEHAELLAAFKAADRDNSGCLSRTEFAAVLSKMAQYVDAPEKIDAAVSQADADGNGRISFAEWLAANDADEAPEVVDELLVAFRRADKDASGQLSADEFAAVLSKMAQFDTPEKVAAAVKQADQNNSGTIDYEEWIAANEAD